jgi:hypothetical protein
MDGNWKLLAEHAARRRAELGLSQIEVAHRGPLSLDRVQSIEGAKSARYRLGTLLALERALDWAEGSVEAVLAGGDPAPVTPHVRGSQLRRQVPAPPADEEERMRQIEAKFEEAAQAAAEGRALLEQLRRERRQGA